MFMILQVNLHITKPDTLSQQSKLRKMSDDFNCDESYLRRILDSPIGADDEHFVKLEKFDKQIHMCDLNVQDYRDQIKYCRKRIAEEQAQKDKIKNEKNECLVEWNMDYKTIEKRLTEQYPEFAP